MILVTDEHVDALYGDQVLSALSAQGREVLRLVIPAGEASKSVDQLSRLQDAALGWGIDRSTPVVALGGGVVGDLAGFLAATLLRGVPLVHVPTSLIAQADSAIGGKTGINHATGKNLLGAFYQPRLVLSDPTVLQSLPYREWTSGLAEVVKYALIGSDALFSLLTEQWDAVLNREAKAVEDIVRLSTQAKAEIVAADEREAGIRAYLNFGHTFAHAIERVAGYGTFTHGEAVALGMRAALHLSTQESPGFDLTSAQALVHHLPVPAGIEAYPIDALMQAMQTDKKVKAGTVQFVLLHKIGAPYIAPAPDQAVRTAWHHLTQ
ncbi:MAG: 3-dehydroquinate synthase [Bacteroidota bacterium]